LLISPLTFASVHDARGRPCSRLSRCIWLRSRAKSSLYAYPTIPHLLELTCHVACATQCITKGDTTGCKDDTDVVCLCGSSTYISSIAGCVQTVCSKDEISAAISAAQGLCQAAVGLFNQALHRSVLHNTVSFQGVSVSIPAQFSTDASSASSLNSGSTIPITATSSQATLASGTASVAYVVWSCSHCSPDNVNKPCFPQ
jgi:hypothetical protein